MGKTMFAATMLAGAVFAAAVASHAADGTVLAKYQAESGLPNPWIKGIFRDGGKLIVSWPGGTSEWDPAGKRFVPFRPGKGFRGASVTGWADFGGKTYAGTESALNVREGGNWVSLDRFRQVQHANELLYTDGKSLFAIARVMFGGVLRFDGANWTIVDRGAGTGIMNNATSVLTRGDEIFVGTTTNGLFHFDGKSWNVIGPEQGLPGVWVTSLAAAEDGVWVGCFQGLARFESGKLRKFGPADGLSGGKITVLKVVKNKLLVGTMDGGLSIGTRGRFFGVSMEQGLSDQRVEAIEEADEGAWVGTVNGLNLVEIR
jgi:hypothetical protein